MRNGSVSLDFIVAMIIVMIMAAIVLSFTYFQQEQIIKSGLKLRVEEMAVSTGSAINRFISSGPEDGSVINITVHNVTGFPFYGILFDIDNCSYNVSDYNITITVGYTMKGTGQTGEVKGRYPVFADVTKSGACGAGFKIEKNGGGFV